MAAPLPPLVLPREGEADREPVTTFVTGHFEWGTTGTFTAYLPRHSSDLPGSSYQTVQAEHDPLSSSFVAPMIDVPVNRVALRPSTHVAGGTQVFYIAGGDLGAIGTDATVSFSHGTSTSSATGDASKVFNVKEAKVVSWDGYNDSLVKAVRVTVDISSVYGLDGIPDSSPDNTDGPNLTSDQIVGLWDVTVTSGKVSGLLMPEVLQIFRIDLQQQKLDDNGNPTDEWESGFDIERTRPYVTITSPVDGAEVPASLDTDGTPVTVQGTVYDLVAKLNQGNPTLSIKLDSFVKTPTPE